MGGVLSKPVLVFSNSCDIADIEFAVGVGGGGVQSHFHVKPNLG